MRCHRVLVTCLLVLTGCGDTSSYPQNLQEYLNRLSTVTRMPLHAGPSRQNESLAIPHDPIVNPLTSSKINLIEFLSLSGCALQMNLGFRNTQLGRTASPSQRLMLDLEFLDLAPGCITLLQARGNMELANTLENASKERLDLLPISLYQVLLQGPEWQVFWERPSKLGDYPSSTSSLIAESISRLTDLSTAWLAGDWSASNREFELLLSDLRAGDGGLLLLAHSRASSALQRATELLKGTRSTAPLCPYGKPTDRSRALEQVVARFLVGGVQPWLVTLRQRKELLLPLIKKLEQSLASELTPDYVQWMVTRDAVLDGLNGVIRSHITEIQATLAECGGISRAGQEAH